VEAQVHFTALRATAFLLVRLRTKFETINRKPRSGVIDTQLDGVIPKKDLLRCTSTLDFGIMPDGIRSAIANYFGKNPKNLKLRNAAS